MGRQFKPPYPRGLKGINNMSGIVVAPSGEMNRIKQFIGYDPRTKKNHPLPQVSNEGESGVSKAPAGETGEKEVQKGEE